MAKHAYLDRAWDKLVWRRCDDKSVIFELDENDLSVDGDLGVHRLDGFQFDSVVVTMLLAYKIATAIQDKMPFGMLFEDIRPTLKRQWSGFLWDECPISDVPQTEETEYNKETGMDEEGWESAVYVKKTEDDPKEPERKIRWKDNPEGYTNEEKRRQMKVASKFVYAAYRVLLEIAGEDELEADDASPLSEAIADLAIARANLAEARKEMEDD